MPTFDGSSSRPSPTDAELLREVLGTAKPRETSLRAYRRSRRRAAMRRAVVVLVLLAAFLGSTSLLTQKQPQRSGAAVVANKLVDPVTTGSINATPGSPPLLRHPEYPTERGP